MDLWPVVIEAFVVDAFFSVTFVSQTELVGSVAGVLFLVGAARLGVGSATRLVVWLLAAAMLLVAASTWELAFLGILVVVVVAAALLVRAFDTDPRLPGCLVRGRHLPIDRRGDDRSLPRHPRDGGGRGRRDSARSRVLGGGGSAP